MKYVVLQQISSGFRSVVFCVAPIAHSDLADRFAQTHRPVSAGFCDFLDDGSVSVFGRSASLDLAPAVGDSELIETMVRATRKMARALPV